MNIFGNSRISEFLDIKAVFSKLWVAGDVLLGRGTVVILQKYRTYHNECRSFKAL